jgi:hypothetical protein
MDSNDTPELLNQNSSNAKPEGANNDDKDLI